MGLSSSCTVRLLRKGKNTNTNTNGFQWSCVPRRLSAGKNLPSPTNTRATTKVPTTKLLL